MDNCLQTSANDGKSRLIVIIAIALLFNIGLRLIPLNDLKNNSSAYLYQKNPILTTYDGYYYLRLTRDYLQGKYLSNRRSTVASRPESAPLLVTLTAIIDKMSGVSPEWVAFFLPVLLSSFLLVIFWFWSAVYENTSIFIISAIAGCANPAWYSRSCLGRFDTDSLLPFFMFIIPFLTYKFCISGHKIERLKLGLLTYILLFLFYMWWVPARYFIPFLVLIPYVLSIFFVRSSFAEKAFKAVLAFVALFIILCLFLIFSGHELRWLGSFGRQLFYVSSFIKIVVHGEGGPFPSVAKGISELARLPFWEVVERVSVHRVVFILSLAGLWLAIRKKKEALLFLIIPMGLGLMGFFAKRFLIFTAPVLSFGLGFLVYSAYSCSLNFFGAQTRRLYYALIAVFMLAVIYSYRSIKVSPVFSGEEMAAAETLRHRHADGPIWAWWDYGYMLEYVTGKPVFIDGGSQQPERVFLSAVPFAVRDPGLAANWIRFFSLRGKHGLRRISRKIGSQKKAVSFLKDVFAYPKALNDFIREYDLPDKGNWENFLFPKGDVYIFIPYKMIDLTDWWYFFGSYPCGSENVKKTYYRIVDGVVKINKNKGIMEIGSRDIVLREIDVFDLAPLPHLKSLDRYDKNLSNLALIFNITLRKALLLDIELKETTCLRLLFNPYGERRFAAIHFKPFQAGVWKINAQTN